MLELPEEDLDTLRQGVRLFNAGDYFEAHENFEELFMACEEESLRSEYLLMLRLAAASVHLTNRSFSSLFMYYQVLKQLEEDGLELQLIEYPSWLQPLVENLASSSREDMGQACQGVDLELALRRHYKT